MVEVEVFCRNLNLFIVDIEMMEVGWLLFSTFNIVSASFVF